MPMPAAAPLASAPNMNMVANSSLAWSDFTPPGFAPGMRLALVQGDPSKAGEYTLRLQFPAGYKFPVHWHPGVENLTVVSGTFQLAMGNTADWSALKNYGPGDYFYIPPRHAHYGGSPASGPSVIQLHGMGPFDVIVGAPK
jgi:quercetin dioxygenase-like cupin family protein